MSRYRLLACALLTGCATSSTVRAARGRPELGTTVTFERPCAAHWSPVVSTARRLHWQIEEEDPSEHVVVANAPVGGFSWGEHIAVVLREDGLRCNIQVYSRRAMALNATATDWEEAFFEHYPPP